MKEKEGKRIFWKVLSFLNFKSKATVQIEFLTSIRYLFSASVYISWRKRVIKMLHVVSKVPRGFLEMPEDTECNPVPCGRERSLSVALNIRKGALLQEKLRLRQYESFSNLFVDWIRTRNWENWTALDFI